MLSWTLLQIQPLFEMVGLQEKNYSYIFGNTVIHHYTRSKSYKLIRAWIWTAYLFYKTRNGLGKRVKRKKRKTWMIGYSWYAWSVRVKDGLTAVVLACVGSSSLAALLLFKKLTDILRCHHLNKKVEKRINTRLYKLHFNNLHLFMYSLPFLLLQIAADSPSVLSSCHYILRKN